MIREEEIQPFLEKAVEKRVTSGVALGVVVQNTNLQQKIALYAGYCDLLGREGRVDGNTFFDLASLTKPLVTALSIAKLVETGVVELNARLCQLLKGHSMLPETGRIRLWQLLAHCSGLPAHRPYYSRLLTVEKKKRLDWLVSTILFEPHEYPTGKSHVYSDLGYILVGKIVEKWSGKSLDVYFRENITDPLGLTDMLFFKPEVRGIVNSSIACTEVCPWTHSWLCGQVDDDNCRVLGGVAGHAGLFGTLEGVSRLCASLCSIWAGESTSGIISRGMLKKIATRVEGSTWCYGFDSPSFQGSSSGSYFSAETIGHLGFTGTSFWLDLQRGITIVLLTNRVHPTRKNEGIRSFRPFIHNEVMQRILGVCRR